MRCEACHGRGSIPGAVVCPECGGSGIGYCCDGNRPGNVQSGFFLYGARVELLMRQPPTAACPSPTHASVSRETPRS
jgi:hypothetical protein